MGCGCGKKSAGPQQQIAASTARPSINQPSVVMYDVVNGEGSLVASYSNPVTARAEARRSAGTVVPRTTQTPVATVVAVNE